MKILLAGILGGVVMFIWTSIAHMALPLGEAGLREIPNESAVLGAMQNNIGEQTGLYIFPGPGVGKNATRQEKNEAILVVFLLAQTSIASFAGRVGFVLAAGILAAIATNVSYWNWYGFPCVYTTGYMFIQIVGFLCVGVAAALVLRRRSPAA